ncbi:MAG TPA: hypothetical protein VE961_13440 [Pyrinomonadaceae bacterium]|nr:hypothetical protein [Pyrinomonadaceae bacterium]
MKADTTNKLGRAIEIATNLSIILVALIGATVLVRNYLLHPPAAVVSEAPQIASARTPAPNPGLRAGPPAGSQISLPNVDWAGNGETVVLALSNKCHFCSESAAFYQQLSSELAQRKDVRIVAVFPQEINDARKYLDDLKVPIGDIRQATLSSIGVNGTPTLMIVDGSGQVKESWVGRLTPVKESEVLSRIKT